MKHMKYILLGLVLMIISVGVLFKDKLINSPEAILNQFIYAMNNEDYEAAYALIYKDEKLQNKDETMLIQYMKYYFDKYDFIKIEQATGNKNDQVVENSQQQVAYPVIYYFENQQLKTGLKLVKDDKWYVEFPFKWTQVEVKAPLGSEVYFNKKLLSERSQDSYVINELLPGDYSIEMKFANDKYPIYQEVITVPENTVIEAPYKTVDICVKTLPLIDVTLSGVTKSSEDGQVVFEDVLVGNYQISLKDEEGYYNNLSQEIKIRENDIIQLKDLELNEKGINDIKNYLEAFYQDYTKGIELNDSSVLLQYGGADKGQWLKAYEEWFVERKKPEKVSLNKEIKALKQGKEGAINVETVEEVVFTNESTTYKVFLGVTIVLKKDGKHYTISDRRINQSIVSYKDDAGKWVAY